MGADSAIDSPPQTGRRIPFQARGLAACALAGCVVMVALLTGHLVDFSDHASSIKGHRRALRAITTEIRAPLAALESGYARIFVDPALPGVPIELDTLDDLIARPAQRILPIAVRSGLNAVRREIGSATEHLENCRSWRDERSRTARRRQAAHRAAEVAVTNLTREVDRLFQVRLTEQPKHLQPGGPEPLLQVKEAAAELNRLLRSVLYEQNPTRLGRIRDHRITHILEQLRHWHHTWSQTAAGSDARAVAAMIDRAALTLAGSEDRTGIRADFVAAQHAWLVCDQQGESLRSTLRGYLDSLRMSRATLERLLADAIVDDNEALQARMHDLWVKCALVAITACAVALLLVRLLRRGAEAQRREVNAAHREAAEAMQAQSLFLANMSHEIRTPMNGVLGMAELLESSPLNDEQKQFARTIRSSSEALLTVINDILDFSKIEAGKLDLDPTDFDLRNSVEDTLDLLRHLAHAKGIDLLCFIGHRVPRFVHGDSTRLRQILMNLVGNAIKFTHEGSVTVVAEILNEHDGVARLAISVTDTGVGIADKVQSRLFKSFTQADPTTTRRYGGTGLGLTISKRLIQMMNGDIWVRSKPGTGSTFTFTVQMERAHGQMPLEEPTNFSGRSSLLVAADPSDHEAMALQVAGWKMGFDVAADAQSAQSRLRAAAQHEHHFDIVLLRAPTSDAALEFIRSSTDRIDLPDTEWIVLADATEEGPQDLSGLARPVRMLRWPAAEPDLRRAVQRSLALEPVDRAGAPDEAAADGALEMHVLVAEDNDINRRVIQQMLRKIGCTATFAPNGREALEHLQQEDFDLVLMDCQMPEMDGYQATRAIRALPPPKGDIPVLALTANVLAADRRACEEAGMDDFLGKPIKKDELSNALSRWQQRAPTPA